MQKNLMLRHRAAMSARRYLDAHGFVDIETPFLYKSTPEGAREFLVPSRLHHGHFYALPQSPQLFKQMLMMAGFDRYYQIVKCFRDEDLRADRQPEFTQIDVETSFLSELEIRDLMEGLVRTMFKEAIGVDLPDPFPVMTYAEAMRDYGSDKPDLRVPLKLTELTDLMRTVDFKVFRGAADLPQGRVAALRLPNGGTLTRKEIDDYEAFVEDLRREGARVHQGQRRRPSRTRKGLQSPIVKFLPSRVLRGDPRAHRRADGRRDLLRRRPARRSSTTRSARCAPKVGHDRGFAEPGWKPLWVVDFPMFEYDDERKALGARATIRSRRPRTATRTCSRPTPARALAKAYDVVLNGWEIGGGSVRIHQPAVQQKVFEALGISPRTSSARNSASCSTRCSTARRRTAASRSASTAWSR